MAEKGATLHDARTAARRARELIRAGKDPIAEARAAASALRAAQSRNVTFKQAAQAYIEKRLKPFVIGKNCDEIEDIWQSAYLQEYFRSGPEGNDALSGIDGALWDILGKRLGIKAHMRCLQPHNPLRCRHRQRLPLMGR